jgi:aldehyde dehydrogenase (NAD+)
MNDETRAFAGRVFVKIGRMPTREQAEAYSDASHHLEAVGDISALPVVWSSGHNSFSSLLEVAAMSNSTKFYISGNWIDPVLPNTMGVVNPATEEVYAQISLGSPADVDRAAAAARAAFSDFSQTTREYRAHLLMRIVRGLEERYDEVALAMTEEMGTPLWFARDTQTAVTIAHFAETAALIRAYDTQRLQNGTLIVREPIGVCSLITPWNWPLSQIAAKVAPALAAGCTVILKPSEVAPMSAIILAEILDEAGVPPGVFNLINGDGPTVGHAMSVHREVDMVSFTGSTRAGISIAKAAADTVKRVHQELGGKSANIILPDADLEKYVPSGVRRCFTNCGQSCQAPTRMLVHQGQINRVTEIAKLTAENLTVGDPLAADTRLGPLASSSQFDRVQAFISAGIDEGATLVCGGLGRPAGLNRGYYARPTIFSDVDNGMTIAREEIFGPVLSIIPYKDEEDAIRIANDTNYGLAGYVNSSTLTRAREVGSRLRAGRIYLNDAPHNVVAPFGGYKQSGNGRECGVFGLEDYLETKAVLGYELVGA